MVIGQKTASAILQGSRYNWRTCRAHGRTKILDLIFAPIILQLKFIISELQLFQFFKIKDHNSILLHSGLNPAWHFWLSTRFSCCLKMKSVENILGYIREQFYRFSRGCKPRENLWNCSRKYTKMFKTDSFLGNKKLSLNQNVWRDHATMQQDVLLHFWVIFLYWNQAEIWICKNWIKLNCKTLMQKQDAEKNQHDFVNKGHSG